MPLRDRLIITDDLLADNTDDQVETVTEFAAAVADGLAAADASFEARRQLIEILDVRATPAVEDGEKVVYVRCLLDDSALSLEPPTSRS